VSTAGREYDSAQNFAEIHPSVDLAAGGLPDNYTLGNLHEVIQISMGWHNGHMHRFEINHSRGP